MSVKPIYLCTSRYEFSLPTKYQCKLHPPMELKPDRIDVSNISALDFD